MAIGGDGTISQVVDGYVNANGINKGVVLGIVPAGTGGDLVRTLGLSKWTPIQAWVILSILS